MTSKPSKPKPSKAEREAAAATKKREREEEKARKAEVARLAKEEAAADKTRKAEEAKTRKDNERQMNDAERQELFLAHADHWARLEDEVRAAIKKREEVEKIAKEDGFTKKQLVAAHKMDDPKRDAKMRAELRTIAQVAVWKGAPLQLNLFGGPKSEAQVTDQAYAEGAAASASGQQRRVPVHYPAPGEAFNAWLAGFDDHQRELAGSVGRGKSQPQGGAGDQERDLRPPDLRDKEAERAGKLGPDQVQSGTPVTRTDYEKGLSSLGDQTRKIIEGAGGKSSSHGLAQDQGIDED